MAFTITTGQQDGRTILNLEGRANGPEEAGGFRHAISAELENGAKKIDLNGAKLTYICAEFVGELVSAHTAAQATGAEIRIVNPLKKVNDLLGLMKLNTVLEVVDDPLYSNVPEQNRRLVSVNGHEPEPNSLGRNWGSFHSDISRDKQEPLVAITTRTVNGVMVLDLAGKAGEGSLDLGRTVTEVLARHNGIKSAVLNFQNLTHNDPSVLIGELVSAWTMAKNIGVSIQPANLTPRVESSLQEKSLLTVLHPVRGQFLAPAGLQAATPIQ